MNGEIEYEITFDKLARGVDLTATVGRAFEVGVAKGMAELSGRARAKLSENIAKYDASWSGVQSTIYTDYKSNSLTIAVLHDQAVFLEYGTGFVGMDSPHPKPTGWNYASGEHSSKGNGWLYPQDFNPSTDPDVIWHNGTYSFTEGRKARPFLYHTWLWVRRSGHQIIMKNIRRELSGVKI